MSEGFFPEIKYAPDAPKAGGNSSPLDKPQRLNIEVEIKDMLSKVQVVEHPLRVVSDDVVPEFGTSVVSRGIALAVGQAHMISSERLPMRTDNADTCHLIVLKTPLEEERYRYDLVHVMDGDLDLNAPGNRMEDIQKITNNKTTALFVSGNKSRGMISTMRGLKYRGITTTKHIKVASGNQSISLVFRPDENETLVKVGNTDLTKEVQVFEGF